MVAGLVMVADGFSERDKGLLREKIYCVCIMKEKKKINCEWV